jgi:excisionase family DNA binding protein
VRDTTTKLAYSTDETCAKLSIGRTALFDLLRRNEITSVKIGRRRLIPAASLDAYLARLVADHTGGHRETKA